MRIGERINVPELNGYDYGAPMCSYVNRAREEVFVIPYEDFDAFSEAFDTSRENLNLREPHRVAVNYLSLSVAKAKAKHGPDNELAVAASQYPIALAGHPNNANSLRLMLSYLLAFDDVRRVPGIPMLSKQVGRIPGGAAGLVAEECDDLLIGILRPADRTLSGLIEIAATPAGGGVLSRAADIAKEIELGGVLRAFPRQTVILAGAVLDRAGWKRVGVPLELGDAAFAFGILKKQYHSRPYTLLLIAKPRDAARTEALDARVLLDDPAAKPAWTDVKDGETTVRTARLDGPPEWLATLLRTQARKDASAVYLSTAAEKGVWLAAVGSHAENSVRVALACLRGSQQLSIFARQRAVGGRETQASPLRDTPGRVAVGMATASGMHALQYPMPIVDIAGIGQPAAVTFDLFVSDKIRAKLRLTR